MKRKVAVIGAGFAGLAAAAYAAKAGFDVSVYEKNNGTGGRGRKYEADGFTFDMGPSWYWMPDVFEEFFRAFGHTTSDFYTLKRLDPSYRVYFSDGSHIDLPADMEQYLALVESMERGAADRMRKFLKEAEYKYNIGMGDFVNRPGLSWLEFADPRLLPAVFRLHMFSSMSTYIRKHFKDERLVRILEFPVIFLGAKPAQTPAMYSLMNYADIALGTWYPMGGMWRIAHAMEQVCRQQGVQFHFNSTVSSIITENKRATGLALNGVNVQADAVIAAADYHHVEQRLLPRELRNYDEHYWATRRMSPSCLLYYIGVNRRIDGLLHHTLFFDRDMDAHMAEIYDRPQWPTDPLFYVSAPSKTDPSVAPEGYENLFILIPIATDLDDTQEVRDRYFDMVMQRLEQRTGQSIMPHVVYKRAYAHREFKADYNAFGGNAFGLANTLSQTAILKPSLRSKQVSDLFFAGQLTTPGPGVPPSLISGRLAAQQVAQMLGKRTALEH